MQEDKIKDALIERVILLQAAEGNKELQAAHMELCRRDPVYWFNNFCFTFDPRRQDANIPFKLYPFQEAFITEAYKCIENQEEFGVEKSRDMGVSWMMMLLFQYCWMFRPGWNFHVGSRRENEVDDATDNPSTLFGKLRYNLSKLPRWMAPRYQIKKLSFVNQTNGNVITGESANPSFGRGARQRAIFFDELAFWECADAAWSGCSSTTNCRIANSTPYGESNRYAKLMNDPRNDVIQLPIDPETKQLIKVA